MCSTKPNETVFAEYLKPAYKHLHVPVRLGKRKVFCKCGQPLQIFKINDSSFLVFCTYCNSNILVSRFPTSINIVDNEMNLTQKMEQKYGEVEK